MLTLSVVSSLRICPGVRLKERAFNLRFNKPGHESTASMNRVAYVRRVKLC